MQGNKALLPIAIIIAGVIVAGAVFITNKQPSGPATIHTEDEVSVTIPPVTEDDHVLGNPNARLVLIEYSDLECPYCKDFHINVQALMDEYGADGEVAWVYRHFPIANAHPKSPRESLASECVGELGGDEAFWEYINKIFDVTPSSNGLDLALLPELAEDVGVDVDEFNTCVEEERYADLIEQQYNDALESGAQGTPYSVIFARTGQVVQLKGLLSYTELKDIFDTLLGRTE